MDTLGLAWVKSLQNILNNDDRGHVEDYVEVLNYQIQFKYDKDDEIILKDKRINDDVIEMRKVFFSEKENLFGHSYSNSAVGPFGNNGLEDIYSILKENATSRRAVLTYKPYGTGKVPCINTIQFLLREGELVINYFSRGQDMYRKFPCDAICIAEMGLKVSGQLNVKLGKINATISSAHIYDSDIDHVNLILKEQYIE